jgi:hypothetical protein
VVTRREVELGGVSFNVLHESTEPISRIRHLTVSCTRPPPSAARPGPHRRKTTIRFPAPVKHYVAFDVSRFGQYCGRVDEPRIRGNVNEVLWLVQRLGVVIR